MRYKHIGIFFCLFSTLLFSDKPKAQGNIDAVGISSKYYNSIVKILLYDSAIARTNPDKALLKRGTGFFVNQDGYIFTNSHVVSMTSSGFCRYRTYDPDSKTFNDDNTDVYNPSMLKDKSIDKINYVGRAAIIVQVFTSASGDSYKLYHAQLIALDTMHFDGAILKINSNLDGKPVSEKFHPVPIGNSDSVSQGQDLCLYGFPVQFNGAFDVILKDLSTLIFGKHSGMDYHANDIYGMIKTDASIGQGNSGGPVFGQSNKVIGIATAAYEKTNVGLIGGINAMYYVSALVPDLQKDLVAEGFTHPAKEPGFLTSTLYKPKPLPTMKDLKRSNTMAGKVSNSASKAYVMLSGYYSLLSTNSFYIGPYSDGYFNTNGGSTSSLSSQEFGFNIRVVKPTFLKQKNNLVGYFFNFCPAVFTPTWSRAPISTSDPKATLKADTSSILTSEISLNVSFGLSYTYLFTQLTGFTVYYAPGVNIDPINYDATIEGIPVANISGGTYGTQTIYYTRQIAALMHTAGFYFKLHAFCVGFEFHLIPNINLQYYVPTGVGNTSAPINGTSSRSTLSAFIGVAL
jgi:S1-C subfamily serine protease